uniref:Lipoxygenase domain-containing protein n=1 Tax=Physcomitrium patens TaxID=3218 RepID=A0A2K1KMV7_PHYPA|nr:hypothetical protein PHYPA_006005 [Physcomitrium patens]
MAQVTVTGSSYTALNKSSRVSRSLKQDELGSFLKVSVPQTRKCSWRYTSITVSRVTDSTTNPTTTTTTTSGQTRGFVPPGYTSVPAVVKVVRKPQLTAEEATENVSDVWADLIGNRKVRLQVVSEELDTSEAPQPDGTSKSRVTLVTQNLVGVTNPGNLGDSDKAPELSRPVLGGGEFIYPRRVRTGCPPRKTDPTKEEKVEKGEAVYVPRDERFEPIKKTNSVANQLQGLDAGEEETPEQARERIRALDALPIPEYFKELSRTATSPKSLLKYPLPKVLSRDRFAWTRDGEFARQTLAGVNPVAISCVEEFPPRSTPSEAEFGPQESVITAKVIERMLEGLTAVELKWRNDGSRGTTQRTCGRKIYAPRALFSLNEAGVLKPIAIELSLPPSEGAPASKRVFKPGQEATGLRTQACTEPYIIATYRQMSALHPISKLLHPHLRYSMEINAAARQSLITADGVIERIFTPGVYALEISAVTYKAMWRFDMEALPEDLIRSAPCAVRLRIEDYPYAADGLLVWSSTEEWIRDYVTLYYPNNDCILEDEELQGWWMEVRTKDHVDKKDEGWWPTMDSPESLVRMLTTKIWIASGHHAAVNFGQYDFTGYVPNQPCLARKLSQVIPNSRGCFGILWLRRVSRR